MSKVCSKHPCINKTPQVSDVNIPLKTTGIGDARFKFKSLDQVNVLKNK